LEKEVALARRAAQQPPLPEQAQFDSMPFDAPLEGSDHRSRKTWRNCYAALFFGKRPTRELHQSRPHEDGAGTGDTTDD